MSNIRIGIDMDGILSDFNLAYGAIITKLTGVEFPRLYEPDYPNNGYPDTWYWERAAGIEKSRESIIWKEIVKDPTFWLKLTPYAGAHEFLFNLTNDISGNDDVYFITNRMGLEVKWQTEQWLKYHGYKRPTVLISQHKAMCCKALKLTHYLDDKTENCIDVFAQSPDTKGFMMARGWNRKVDGIPRIHSLEEFMKVLRKDSAIAIEEGK